MRITLRDAEVAGRRYDVTVSGCRVVLVEGRRIEDGTTDHLEVEAAGGVLLPGLHDHHLHLMAMAAASAPASIDCSAASTLAELSDLIAAASAAPVSAPEATPDRATASARWLRATGYHESIAGVLDRHLLDRLCPERPIRIQHRSGALWMLNSPALDAVRGVLDDSGDVERDPGGEPNGRLWRYDCRLRPALPAVVPDLRAVGERLLRLGITGVTDATPDLDATGVALLLDAHERGDLPQDLMLLGAPDSFINSATVQAGPAKLLLRDHDLPTPEAVAAWVKARHRAGRPVAIHCVTSDALAISLAALELSGSMPGDRIEHAGVVPPGLRSDLGRLGLRVVTNPGFLHSRGEAYLADVGASEHQFLYPYRSLHEAGIPIAAASDAPHDSPDPWSVIRAATRRTTASGTVLGPDERVSAHTALDGYLSSPQTPGGPAQQLHVGRSGGLCLLRAPLTAALAALSAPTGLPGTASEARSADRVHVVTTGGTIEALTPAEPCRPRGTSANSAHPRTLDS